MKYKISNAVKAVGGTVTAFVLALAVGVNVSPDLAMAMSDVPVLGELVKVVTFEKYEKKIGGSEADVIIPKIEGLKNEELMREINEALGNDASKLIDEFEKEAIALQAEFGDEAHLAVGSDYKVITDNEKYFAIDVCYYTIEGSAAEMHKFYTVDKATGEMVVLNEVIDVNEVNAIVKNEMERRNNEENGAYFVEEFEGIDEEQKFYINEYGKVVIVFDEYTVAAGSEGCPEFVIE